MKKSLLACAVSCLFISPVYANIPEIASGMYYLSESEFPSPLLAIHNDTESSWFYPKTVISNMEGRAYGASCNNQLCVVVGSLRKPNGAFYPLMATSRDGGNNWLYMSEFFTQEDDELNGASCNSATCVVAGDKNFNPWIMSYQQDHWVTSSIANLPADYTGAMLDNVLCQENFCIISGIYFTKNYNYHPFLVTSQDKEKTQWSYTPSIEESSLQAGDYSVYELSCNNKVCVGAGAYNLSGGGAHTQTALLATSYDQGKTWVYSKDIFAANINGFLGASTCYDDFCIAVGTHYTYKGGNKSLSTHPLIAVSEDAGKTWIYQKTIANLPADKTPSLLNTVSCNNKICVIGALDTSPILLSRDRGKTWEITKNCSSNVKDAITKINCNEESCTGVGYSVMKNKIYPLVMTTHDNGNTWSCAESLVSSLPKDFVDGKFENGTFGGSDYTTNRMLKDKMKFLQKMR